MFGKRHHNRRNQIGMIVVTFLGACAGLCIGAGACMVIINFMSR